MTEALPDYLERADQRPFEDDEARELLEHAHLVEELTLHPGWQILSGRIQAEAERWERRVLDGKIDDLNEYVKCTNYARGLRHILEAPQALRDVAERARPTQEEPDD